MKPVRTQRELEAAAGGDTVRDAIMCFAMERWEPGSGSENWDQAQIQGDMWKRSRSNGEVRTGRRRDVGPAWAQGEERMRPGNRLEWEIGPEQGGEGKIQAEKEVQMQFEHGERGRDQA